MNTVVLVVLVIGNAEAVGRDEVVDAADWVGMVGGVVVDIEIEVDVEKVMDIEMVVEGSLEQVVSVVDMGRAVEVDLIRNWIEGGLVENVMDLC